MNRDRMYELRILNGTHEGARALLPDSPQLLGSGGDCDLILSDEGVLAQHARLELQEDGSTILRWLDGELEPLTIRPGEATQLGPVQIAVEHSDAPWRSDLPVVAPQAASGSGSHEDLHEPQLLEDGLTIDDAPASTAPTQDVATGARLAPNLTLVVLSVFAIASVAAVWWAMRGPKAGPEAASSPAPAVASAAASAAQTGMLQATIKAIGLADRVRIDTSSAVPVVHAFLLSDDEAEQLASALSRLSPRPALKLVSVEDTQQALADALQAAAGAEPLRAKYLGEGRFRVEGRVLDEAAREQLLADLARRFPGVRAFENGLLTDAEAATGMLDDLRRQGMGNVDGQWTDGVLELKVRLSPGDIPRWEQALLAAASRHQLRFRASLDLVDMRVTLPFTVRSVVSSDTPYVMLADGRRLMTGAVTDGWKLLEVQPRAVIFEAADGRRTTMER